MKKLLNYILNFILFSLVILSGFNLSSQTVLPYNSSPCDNPNWRILWMDDFNTLDLNKWEVKNNHDQWGQHASVNIDTNVSVSMGI